MKGISITGFGVVSPLGVGREAFVRALGDPEAAAKAAFEGEHTVFDAEKIPDAHAAEVWNYDAREYLGPKGLRNLDRLTKFLIVAGKHALEDAGIKRNGEFVAHSPARVGICSSTAYGSLDAITELNLVAELEDPRYINPSRFPNTVINAAAGYVSIWEDLRAPNVTVVDGNCGAIDTVLACETHLRHRRGDAFLVGGGEPLSEPLYLAYRKLGAMAESADGVGLRFGEGAALLVAEREDEARARGASILANIRGYGTAFEAPLSPAILVHASADPVRRAIESAMRDAGVVAADIDAVCSAACGLDAVDHAERTGIAAAIGAQVAIATPKAIYGETFGGAGALGMATALAWFEGAPVAPVVAGTVPADVRTVVVTTVGFYGNVSAVVLKKP